MTTTLKNPAKEFLAMPIEHKWSSVIYPGLSERYQISTVGEVKSPKGKVLVSRLQGDNLAVSIGTVTDSSTTQRVDRLVLSTFVGFEPLKVPNHLNGDEQNCSLTNLAWAEPTPRELASLRMVQTRQGGGPPSRRKRGKKAVANNGEVVKHRAAKPRVSVFETEVQMTRTYQLRGVRVEVGEDGDIRSMDPNPTKGLNVGQTMALATIMARVAEMNILIGAHKNL
jgi:hypothetical protein